MARTTNRPSTATRPNTATASPDINASGSFDEQDQRGEGSRLGDNTERRENLTSVRDEPNNERGDFRDNRDDSRENRDDSRENRDDSRENHNGRDDRPFGENRDERTPRDGDTEGSRREQSPTLSAGMDAFAPVLEAWKQVFTSWSQLAETIVKAQQDAFAGMISAANTTAKNINVDDRPDSELIFSGSRTTASTPDRIERDRR